MKNEKNERQTEIIAAIDREGTDLSRWRDAGLAATARRALLADRSVRTYLDGAVAMDGGLRLARSALDEDIARSGAAARVNAAVLARLAPRHQAKRSLHRRWMAVAATLIIAAGLGSVVDLQVLGTETSATSDEVVVLDPLVFATNEIDTQ